MSPSNPWIRLQIDTGDASLQEHPWWWTRARLEFWDGGRNVLAEMSEPLAYPSVREGYIAVDFFPTAVPLLVGFWYFERGIEDGEIVLNGGSDSGTSLWLTGSPERTQMLLGLDGQDSLTPPEKWTPVLGKPRALAGLYEELVRGLLIETSALVQRLPSVGTDQAIRLFGHGLSTWRAGAPCLEPRAFATPPY